MAKEGYSVSLLLQLHIKGTWCKLHIKERKGTEEYLYSVFIQRLVSHSFTCKLRHACLFFVSVHQMTPPMNVVANI